MTSIKPVDPIGPGTAPWNAFSKALRAAEHGRLRAYGLNRNQSFPQLRAEMRRSLKYHRATVETVDAWTQQLDERAAKHDWE